MICPFTATVHYQTNLKEKVEEWGMDCIKEDCAWYDKNKKQCVVQSIKDALMRVQSPSIK